jgi:hypothetical protein
MTRPTRHLAFRVVTALTLAGPAAAQAPPPNASFVLHNQGAAAFREVYQPVEEVVAQLRGFGAKLMAMAAV